MKTRRPPTTPGEILHEEFLGPLGMTQAEEPEKGKISVSSPIGQALVGSKVGDEIRVRTPKGIQEFEILGIY